ncbi:MAG: RnfABCDGE type electron transport complex subunit D [Clostridia bacterium]|nr:RnfABCDGE type electron transport complex subunit D [Clostridia bacterium]
MANSNVIVSSSPHIKGKDTTRGLMIDVLVALAPALICGVFYFGFRALFITSVSVLSCLIFEYGWQKLLKKPVMISDCSAALTGVLLAFNMPVTVPWWIPVIGAFVAVVIVKQLFGGIGCNFMNPALAGRAFLLASWPVLMTNFVPPFTTGFKLSADVVSSATPLAIIKTGTGFEELPAIRQMFLGNIGGCIGETSSLALLLGGLYLILRRVIKPHIPVAFIGTVAAFSFLFSRGSMSAVESLGYSVFGGGLMLGAFFMATDYVTSPVTTRGQVIMGVGCGFITFLIRRFGGYPEGVSYAILLMNIATPLIDKWCRPKKFGYVKKKTVKQ